MNGYTTMIIVGVKKVLDILGKKQEEIRENGLKDKFKIIIIQDLSRIFLQNMNNIIDLF